MLNARIAAAMPSLATGAAAIVAGGAVAAAVAYQPTEHLIWMVAFLVLIVGMMQILFGAGQAWLSEPPPGATVVWGQWVLFNAGSAIVIAGTFLDRTGTVALGTLLFVAAIAWFLLGVRHTQRRGWCVAYRACVGAIFVSACTGLVISAVANGLV